jgi:hypothetical protein
MALIRDFLGEEVGVEGGESVLVPAKSLSVDRLVITDIRHAAH